MSDDDRYEAEQARLMRRAREKREAVDAAWQAAWDAECAKPIRQRQYFSFAEIADALARDPRTLAVEDPLRARILSDLTDWVGRQQFDLVAGDVVMLSGDPPSFEAIAPLLPREIIVFPEYLMLRRDAARRFTEAHIELPNAAGLLRQWFTGEAASAARLRSQPVKKAPIPNLTLLKHLQAIKASGGPIPAVYKLWPEVVADFPSHHVTRRDVQTVHNEVWGKLPPGRRRQSDAT
jgi:hypothetical protein